MTEPGNITSQLDVRSKKAGGGAAFGGGANFQAQLTAIVAAHVLGGKPLGWLEGICDDRPVAVWAESEGPGDDLRIELLDGSSIEVQAKKGLERGDKLWAPLLRLAKAIHENQIAYGILVVASDTSATIRKNLADDIERIGQGRTDRLSVIGADLLSRLDKQGTPAIGICSSLRIREVETLIANNRDVNVAMSVLREVCEDEAGASSAFDILGYRALRLIENRGRWALRDLVLLLRSKGIQLRNDGSPAALLNRHAKWVCSTHNDYVIIGVTQRLSIEHLLPMQLEHRPFEVEEAADALAALERYQSIPSRPFGSNVFDSIWTARFKKLAVVVAGPGLGKSTMLRELAHQYALDGFTVLSASLAWIAAGMREGRTFSDRLFTKSFDGSGVSASEIIHDKQFHWVVLLDALDECGQDHAAIAEEIRCFSQGHPNARIVVTTRPIGYTSNALLDWQHYNLLPPEDGVRSLRRLLSVIAPDQQHLPTLFEGFGGRGAPTRGFAISPQLLGMSAVLIQRGRALPSTRVKLYAELIKLFEENKVKPGAFNAAELTDIAIVVLDLTGWLLFQDPLQPLDQLVNSVALELAPLIEKPLVLCKGHVRGSLEHWERLGLIETLHYDGTRLVTFIHKTFCEFVAARYLSSQPLAVVERAVDRGDLAEVVNFGVALGLTDKLLDLYLHRHACGEDGQLLLALELLAKPERVVSTERLMKLIQKAFESIDDTSKDRFAIALALCGIGEQAANFVKAEAVRRLSSGDSAIRLLAWTLVAEAQACVNRDDLAAALNQLAQGVAPAQMRVFGEDREERSDLVLLQRLAMCVLKAQPDHLAWAFAEHDLRNSVFSSLGFILQVNEHLEARGLERLTTAFDQADKKTAAPNVRYGVPGLNEVSMGGILAVARAFVPEDPACSFDAPRKLAFPQITGLLRASGYMDAPLGNILWSSHFEEVAARSALRYVASLLPLDLEALQDECCNLLRLNGEVAHSFFEIITHVDIQEICWAANVVAPPELPAIKRAILHPSAWLSKLAACICEPFPMALAELEALLSESTGASMHYLLYLIELNHREALIDSASRRLRLNCSGDVSAVFVMFKQKSVMPSPEMMNVTLTCLCSDSEKTARTATELLQFWMKKGIHLDKDRLERAVDHWGGRSAHSLFEQWFSPLHFIIELADNADGQSDR
ncbi:hypothetical protein F3J44_21220 [Pantoea sp. Tr-811]|uniref:NACHT domain-containing protein n=1 Tax=Pantoea sp. Tr-811 TaxID=2608361 RepID=UPI00141DD356|nr:hypothetical protein [Pantoea sp. Tr-811]NIF28888.1 hypothetical protein [Pantoea sp. Tr-811]